jgi:hypothetical protein
MQNPCPTFASDLSGNLSLIDEAEDPLRHLTPEEQMALFEAELLMNDWGNQPG